MDEDQKLASPISGGIRAIRRSVSSSMFRPPSRPQTPQVDPVSTNLILQNSIALTNVSNSLTDITKQLTTLNFSLSGIKETLAVNDQLEKSREQAKTNREKLLAEQGLRDARENELEQKIKGALTAPLKVLSEKTGSALTRLTDFFLILAGGWLTSTGIDLLNALASGNTEKINRLKKIFVGGLVAIGGIVTAAAIGIGKTLLGITRFAGTIGRITFGGLFKNVLGGLGRLFSTVLVKAAPFIKFLAIFAKIKLVQIATKLATILGLGQLGKSAVKQGGKKFDEFIDPKTITQTRKILDGTERLFIKGGDDIVGSGFKLKNILQNPLTGNFAKGTFKIGAKGLGFDVLLDVLFGKPLDEALANAAGYAASYLFAAKTFAPLAFAPFPGARPLYFLLTLGGGIMGSEAVESLYESVKGIFGLGNKVNIEEKSENNLTELDLNNREDVISSVTPIKREGTSEFISFNPDAGVDVINLSNNNENNIGTDGFTPPEQDTNTAPSMTFTENTYTLFAFSQFGAPAA